MPPWEPLLEDRSLVGAVLVVLLAHNLPVIRVLTAPLALLGTWLHELSHALAALAVGGSARRITLHSDGSGLAATVVPDRTLARAIVAGAGYPGASLAGAALLWARNTSFGGSDGLMTLAAAAAVTTVLWVRNAFGVVALGALAVALAVAARELSPPAARFTYACVAISVSLHAFGSIRALFGAEHRAGGRVVRSDAATLADLLWLPSPIWSISWALWAIAATGWALLYPA